VRVKLAYCLLFLWALLAPTAARADICSDLQAAIAKTAALRQEMQREAAPLYASGKLPTQHQGVCTAAQNLRNQIVLLAGLIDPKCLDEEQRKSVTITLNTSMREASGNIGLFCP
jgi:hypothetical protein